MSLSTLLPSRFAAVSVVACLTFPAIAQWSVVRLHPSGSIGPSAAYGGAGSQQVGSADLNGSSHALVWNGSATDWQDLHPVGASQSTLYATSGSLQVGTADGHASLWSGTAGSWVDLHPQGQFSSSAAYDISGVQQVGFAAVNSVRRAGLWSGSSDSWVDLTPNFVTGDAVAMGTTGSHQVGFVTVGSAATGRRHASLWSGSSDTWVDLQAGVPGLYSSIALAVSGNQQVGGGSVQGIYSALLWQGSASSCVNLHRPEWGYSEALATNAAFQAGHATVPGLGLTASLWSGSAATWEDLGAWLGDGFTSSTATAVWQDPSTLYVGGLARNSATGLNEAVLWRRPLPSPGAISLLLAVPFTIHCRRRHPDKQ